MPEPAGSVFLGEQRLPASYLDEAKDNFEAIIQDLLTCRQEKPGVLLGINGCQGSGKTTLAAWLKMVLTTEHALNVVCLSLDDFYFGKQTRRALAQTVHPLLATRGVPGTHDIDQALATLHELQTAWEAGKPVPLPRFDKASDDLWPRQHWDWATPPVDIVILEGWCLGARPQSAEALLPPVNDLEAQQDGDGHWRRYVNQKLASGYAQLFDRVDLWVMLQAPSFAVVHGWRMEQERKLAHQLQASGHAESADALMSAEQIQCFVQYYQRLTEHMLQDLPGRVDHCYQLDSDRRIIRATHRLQQS